MAPGAGIQLPDIDLSGDDASFADELSQFLDEHLDGFKARFTGAREADAQMAVAREWQAAMASGGWAAISLGPRNMAVAQRPRVSSWHST